MKISIFFISLLFCFCTQAQKSAWEIQIGFSSSTTWLKGKNDLDILFSKDIQLPSPNFGVQYAISKTVSIEFDYRLGLLTSNYSIPSIDLFGEMVMLDYRVRSLFYTFQLNSNFLILPKKNTLLTTGIFFSGAEKNKWEFTNLSEFTTPVLSPFFAQVDLKDWNYGFNFELKQPLYSWKLSRIYLAGFYVLGLKNVNKDAAHSLKTRMIGLKIFWGVNLKRRKK